MFIESGHDEVCIGHDRELFLFSNRHKTFDWVAGKLKPSGENIATLSRTIEARRAHALSIGAKYFHLVAPDKHNVCDDKFPIEIQQRLAKDFLAATNNAFVYPDEYLKGYREHRLYWRTHSHWSDFGSVLIAALIAKVFGVIDYDVTASSSEMHSVVKRDSSYSGDLEAVMDLRLGNDQGAGHACPQALPF